MLEKLFGSAAPSKLLPRISLVFVFSGLSVGMSRMLFSAVSWPKLLGQLCYLEKKRERNRKEHLAAEAMFSKRCCYGTAGECVSLQSAPWAPRGVRSPPGTGIWNGWSSELGGHPRWPMISEA